METLATPLIELPEIERFPKSYCRVGLLGIHLDCVDTSEALDLVEEFISSGKGHYIVTPNLHMVSWAKKDPKYRKAITNAHLCLTDGVPILWYSRYMKGGLKGRVNGVDFVHALCERLSKNNGSVFLLGTSDATAKLTAANLLELYPGLVIAGRYSPPHRDWSHEESLDICERIHGSGGDVVFIALNQPRQELWMEQYHQQVGAAVCVGIGGALDIIAGKQKRAPEWMQRNGLEWLFRVMTEPRRLAKRYADDALVTSTIAAKAFVNKPKVSRQIKFVDS